MLMVFDQAFSFEKGNDVPKYVHTPSENPWEKKKERFLINYFTSLGIE